MVEDAGAGALALGEKPILPIDRWRRKVAATSGRRHLVERAYISKAARGRRTPYGLPGSFFAAPPPDQADRGGGLLFDQVALDIGEE